MSRREPLPPRGERVAERRGRSIRVLDALADAYPDARCALVHDGPWQLLVATMLSAQCTDERVNLVTPALFAQLPDAATTAGATQDEVEELVRSTGFFRQKSRNIIATARAISERHGGEVPARIEDLVQLPGVARKTANVVVANCFPHAVDGIAVDTHVQRVSRRLGLTRSFAPEAIERDLMRLLPHERWTELTYLLIDHGRAVCRAPRPRCAECPIAAMCPSRARFEQVAATGSTRTPRPGARAARG